LARICSGVKTFLAITSSFLTQVEIIYQPGAK
jgi:hypothetical protein